MCAVPTADPGRAGCPGHLETLVGASPVGVVVFDARTGKAVSLNRDAKRILRDLHTPDGSAKELAERLTCRCGDGREVRLAEWSMARQPSAGTPARAEEVELSVPGGRSVTTLVDATPIPGEDGGIESVVVTMLGLGALEELERMQAEFLGLVRRELRAPLASIKGSTATVLGTRTVFGATEMLHFFRIIDEHADRMNDLIGDLLDAGRIRTGMPSVSREPPAVEEADDARVHSVPHGRLRPGPEPTRILVVDDDPHARRFARDALAAAGYATLATGDPRDLPGIIRAERCDLVLLDLMLPETDGIALMERLPELADLPVIFVSANGEDETIARAFEVGAEDFIVKPYSPTDLTTRIRAVLRRRAGRAGR